MLKLDEYKLYKICDRLHTLATNIFEGDTIPRKGRYYVVEDPHSFSRALYPKAPDIAENQIVVCRGYKSGRPLFEELKRDFLIGRSFHAAHFAKAAPETIGLKEISANQARENLKKAPEPENSAP